MATAPVCGIQVSEIMAAARAEYGGVTYQFGPANCHWQFLAHPEPYVVPALPAVHA